MQKLLEVLLTDKEARDPDEIEVVASEQAEFLTWT
jgi:hypothetical protein